TAQRPACIASSASRVAMVIAAAGERPRAAARRRSSSVTGASMLAPQEQRTSNWNSHGGAATGRELKLCPTGALGEAPGGNGSPRCRTTYVAACAEAAEPLLAARGA